MVACNCNNNFYFNADDLKGNRTLEEEATCYKTGSLVIN